MERFKSRILWIFIVLGVILLADGVKDMVDSKKTPIDFATIKDADFKNGVIVEGDVTYNYGIFEEEYRTTYGIKTGESDYVYMIPYGNDKFIGLKSKTTSQQQELDVQTEQTYNVVTGTSSQNPTKVHFKGRIKTMGTEEKGYLRDYMISMGYTQSVADNAIMGYQIECVNFGGGLGMIGLGTVLLLVGILIIIVPILEQKKNERMIYSNDTQVTPRRYSDETVINKQPQSLKMPSGVIEDDFPTFEEPEEVYEQPELAVTEEKPKSGLSLRLKDD